MFRASMPSVSELTEIYDARYFRDDPGCPDLQGYADYLSDASSHRRNARRRLRVLAAYRDVPGRLLDVGCAAGFFVAEAEAQGWDAQGVDVSEEIVAWGRAHVSERLAAMPFVRVELTPASVHAVTMWDYIEHSIDPQSDLERVHKILEPGGLLALSTGDVRSVVARWSGRRWHLLTPRHHNYFFSAVTLGRMLRGAGLEVVSEAHNAAWYSMEHLIYKLEALVPGGSGRALSRALRRTGISRVEVPINLLDIVTVIARKPAVA
jgi:2-polyprenyl-3-methyl-5-hydroxy-6-metoxy-1,4-benzoquinol methylase